MAVTSRIRLLYLTQLSKPQADRLLYRAIRRSKAKRILEIGLGNAMRATRMIEVAGADAEPREIHYAGIDPFEARSTTDRPGLSVKAAYRTLIATGARVRLCPGDPYLALSMAANSLGQADLIVISADVDQQSLRQAWLFLPRLLHGATQVFLQQRSEGPQPQPFRLLSRSDIESRAAASQSLSRRAA